jgi:multisubunit Na+/H+ antiporter MnhE subunit
MKVEACHVAEGALLSAVLAVFWLACVATVRLHEMLVGIGAIVISAAFSMFVVSTLPLRFRPRLSELAEIWRLPWNVATDLVQVLIVLLLDFAGRRAPSLFVAAPWGPVRNNARDTARRALAISYTTVSPNMVVVGIDCGRGKILFHQIKKSGVPKLTQNLGAGTGAGSGEGAGR